MKKKVTKKAQRKPVLPEAELCRNIVQDCNFYGVKFDAVTIDAVQTIARAFQQNAVGLSELVKVFKGSQVKLDSLLRFTADDSIAICGSHLDHTDVGRDD